MRDDKVIELTDPGLSLDPLSELLKRGARQLIE